MPITLEELANQLRKFAELTATHSKNWDNYESIILDALTQVSNQSK